MAIRIMPRNFEFEPEVLEGYLERMERRGLRLTRMGWYLLHFEAAQPREMRYRVDYFDQKCNDEDRIDWYEQAGWEHIGAAGYRYHVFRAAPDTPELHTDPVFEAGEWMRPLYQNLLGLALADGLLLALAFLFLRDGHYRVLLFGPFQELAQYLLLLVYFIGMGFITFELVHNARQLYAMRRGRPRPHRSTRSGLVRGVAMALIWMMIPVSVFWYHGLKLFGSSDGYGVSREEIAENVEQIAGCGVVWPMDTVLDGITLPPDTAYTTYYARFGETALAEMAYDQRISLTAYYDTDVLPEMPDQSFQVRVYRLRSWVNGERMMRWLAQDMSALDQAPQLQTLEGADVCWEIAMADEWDHAAERGLIARRGDLLIGVSYVGQREELLPVWLTGMLEQSPQA